MLDTVTSMLPEKRSIITSTFILIMLAGAVVAGVILVQREQDIRNKAASGSACDQSPDCYKKDDPGDSGSYSDSQGRNVDYFEITHQGRVRFDSSGTDENGCYEVNISGSSVSWNRLQNTNVCKDISNIQVWFTNQTPEPSAEVSPSPSIEPSSEPSVPPSATASPTSSPTTSPTSSPSSDPSVPPEPITASCLDVKVFDTQWNRILSSNFDTLEAGDVIRFSVGGSATDGTFSKARFIVNGASIGETSLIRPGTDEFYIEYAIPANIDQLSVKGEVLHSVLGWL